MIPEDKPQHWSKAFRALIAIVVIFCCPILFAASQDNNTLVFQGATFTADLKQASLQDVIERIQKETGIWFRVSKSGLDERVSVQFEHLPISQGLKRILRTMNYSFLYDQDNNLIGAFVFGKASRKGRMNDPADLNEKVANAVMDGDTAGVVALLDKGADVNAKGKHSGWTPLFLAARKGDTELVNFLLNQGADANVKSSVRRRTAIMEATRNRNLSTVKALLHADSDVDSVDWEGYTALMFAAISGQSDIVDVLLTHGADVNLKNKADISALMMASGYPDVCKKLMAAGAVE